MKIVSKKKVPKKRVETNEKLPEYHLKLELLGNVYECFADSILRGITKLDYPKTIKVGFLTVTKGTEATKVMLYPRVLNKLKVNKIFQQIWDKRINIMLK